MSKKILLTDVVPDIEQYWDHEKNNGREPYEFGASASDKVWTFCPVCRTSVQRNIRFTWQADKNGVGKVICCRTCVKRNRKNSLVALFPGIVAYWDDEKNEHTPDYYTISSGKKVYTNCPICGKSTYRAISDIVRKNASGSYELGPCMSCAKTTVRRAKTLLKSSISVCCPDISKYWAKENTVSPDELLYTDNTKIYTHCPSCNKILYRAAHNSFVKNGKTISVMRCQVCAATESNRAMAVERNGVVVETNPEILDWWDSSANTVTPESITRGAHDKVALKCPTCNHRYKRTVHKLINKCRDGVFRLTACPECGYSSRPDPEDNILALCPEIANWWSYEKNGDKKPEQFTKCSQFKAYMTCPDCGMELHSGISSLVKTLDDGTVVIRHDSMCRKYRAQNSDNNIVKLYPDIIKWWDKVKNFPDNPEDFTIGSPHKAYFKCPDCGLVVHIRISDAFKVDENGVPAIFRCSSCLGTRAIPGVNSLKVLYPEIADSCISNVNTDNILPDAESRYEWKCKICGGTWFGIVKDVVAGHSCPYCDGRQALKDYNDLATTHPDLAKEWSPNNERNVDTVLKSFTTPYLWICATCKGEYSYSVAEREVGDNACPYCDGRQALKGFNDLATTHPDLAEEWSPNNKRSIHTVLKSLTAPFLWVCPTCKGEYSCSVAKRKAGDSACPYCNDRKALFGFNSFKVRHPDLMQEWMEAENIIIGMDADKILDTCSDNVWWKCPICNYPYTMTIKDRLMKQKRGHNPCPRCNGRRQNRLHF